MHKNSRFTITGEDIVVDLEGGSHGAATARDQPQRAVHATGAGVGKNATPIQNGSAIHFQGYAGCGARTDKTATIDRQILARAATTQHSQDAKAVVRAYSTIYKPTKLTFLNGEAIDTNPRWNIETNAARGNHQTA